MSYIAYGDESERIINSQKNYLLGAVIIPRADIDEIEFFLDVFNQRRKQKLHWHSLPDKAKKLLASQIKNLFSEFVYVNIIKDADKKTERARRKCLAQLFWQLDNKIIFGEKIEELILEGRSQNQNRLDKSMYDCLHDKHTIQGNLKFRIEKGEDTKLLWLADVILGIVGDSLTGKNIENFNQIKEKVVVSEVF